MKKISSLRDWCNRDGVTLLFIFSYIRCFLAPISSFLDPAPFRPVSSLSIFLLLCDAIALLCNMLIDVPSSQHLLWLLENFGHLPVILVPVCIAARCDQSLIAWLSLLRLLHVKSLPYFYRLATERLRQILEQRGYPVGDLIFSFVGKALAIFFYASAMACCWFGISCRDSGLQCSAFIATSTAGRAEAANWIRVDSVINKMGDSIMLRYFRSLHFIVQSLFTIGYGDIHPLSSSEICFSFIVIVSGALFYAYIISVLTLLLSNYNFSTVLFRSEMMRLGSYLRLRKISTQQRSTYLEYFGFLFTRQLGLSEKCIISHLPEHLAEEYRMQYCSQLKRVPFFQHQSDAFVGVCCRYLEFATIPRFAKVFEAGFPYRCLYLIRTGKLDIYSCTTEEISRNDDMKRAVSNHLDFKAGASYGGNSTKAQETGASVLSLVSGDYVGDFQLITGREFTGLDVICAECTEVAMLSFDSLVAAMDEYSLRYRRRASSAAYFKNAVQHHMAMLKEHNAATIREEEGISSAEDGNRFGTSFTRSVQVTIDAHNTLMLRMNKTKTTINLTLRTKRNIAAMMEQLTLPMDRQFCLISPENPIRFVWMVFMTAVYLYFICAIPLRILLRHQLCGGYNHCFARWEFSLLFDYCLDTLVVVDIILHSFFFTFHLEEHGGIGKDAYETNHMRIFERFLQSRLCVVSICLVIPFDLIALKLNYALCFRLTKLIALFIIHGTVKDVRIWLERYRGVNCSDEAMTVVYLALATLIVLVWASVIWGILAQMNGGSTAALIASLYWCLTTMTTTGYGDLVPNTLPSTVFTVIFSFLGPSIFATIVAKLTSYLSRVDVLVQSVEHKMLTTKYFMRNVIFPAAALNSTSPGQRQLWLPHASCDINGGKVGRGSIRNMVSRLGSRRFSVYHRQRNSSVACSTASSLDDSSCHPQLLSHAAGSMRQRYLISNANCTAESSKISLYSNDSLRSNTTNSQQNNLRISTISSAAAVDVKDRTKPVPLHPLIAGSAVLTDAASFESATKDYFRYMESDGCRMSENDSLPVDLPSIFTNNLRLAIVKNIIKGVRLFAGCDEIVINAICLSVEQRQYPKNFRIVEEHYPPGLHIIMHGSVQVFELNDARAYKRYTGEFFGEGMLLDEYSLCSMQVVSLEDCETWFLSRSRLQNILIQHDLLGNNINRMKQKLHRYYPRVRSLPASGIVIEEGVAPNQQPPLSISMGSNSSSISNSADYNRTRKILKGHLQRRHNIVVDKNDLRLLQKLKRQLVGSTVHIVPDSIIGCCWSIIVLCTIFYNFICLPIRIAFCRGYGIGRVVVVADYLYDAVLIIDIIMRLSVIAYYDHEELICAHEKIFYQYLYSVNFFRHCVAVIPFELMALFHLIKPFRGIGTLQIISILRINRLLRLSDMQSLWSQLESATSKFISRSYGIRLHQQGAVMRLSKLIALIFMTAHVFGCLFFLIAMIDEAWGSDHNWTRAVGITISANRGTALFSQYLYAFYWAIALLSTIGYGDISPVTWKEQAFNILLFFIGTIIYAMVIINLQEIISQMDSTSDIFKARLQMVQQFLHRESAESGTLEEINQRVNKSFERLWYDNRGAMGSEVKTFLPDDIYVDGVANALKSQLQHLFFVQNCSVAFRRAFLSNLKPVHYLRGDFIFRTGELANRLYFVSTGSVSLVTLDLNTATNTGTSTRSAVAVWRHGRRRSSLRGRCQSATAPASTATESQQHAASMMDSLKSPADANIAGPKKRSTKRRKTYLKVTDGCLGHTEFFTGSRYSCSACTTEDAVLFEIDFASFWQLVVDFRMESLYQRILRKDCSRLVRNSTMQLVQTLDANISQLKLMKMMSATRIEALPPKCILPTSLTAFLWNSSSLLMILITCIYIPFVFAFIEHSMSLQLAVDTIATVFFAVDMHLRSSLMAVTVEGVLLTGKDDIRAFYSQVYLRGDLLSTLPIPAVVYAATGSSLLYRCLRWLALLRLGRVSKIAVDIRKWVTDRLTIGREVLLSGTFSMMMSTMCLFLYTAHLLACLLCFLGKIEQHFETFSWIEANQLQHRNAVDVFITAFYWALYTLSTVGYGSVSIATDYERIFCIVAMIMGSILSAMLAAVISSITDSNTKQTTSKRRLSEATVQFLRNSDATAAATEKVHSIVKAAESYYEYIIDHLNGCDDAEIWLLLPPAQANDLKLKVCWKQMKRRSFLDPIIFDKVAQHGCVLSIIRAMEPYIALSDETLQRVPYCDLLEDLPLSRRQCVDVLVLRRGVVSLSVFDAHWNARNGDVIDLFDYRQKQQCCRRQSSDCDHNDTGEGSEAVAPVLHMTMKSLRLFPSPNTMNIKEVNCTLHYEQDQAFFVEASELKNSSAREASEAGDTLVALFDSPPVQLSFDNDVVQIDVHVGHSDVFDLVYQAGRGMIDMDDVIDDFRPCIQQRLTMDRQQVLLQRVASRRYYTSSDESSDDASSIYSCSSDSSYDDVSQQQQDETSAIDSDEVLDPRYMLPSLAVQQQKQRLVVQKSQREPSDRKDVPRISQIRPCCDRVEDSFLNRNGAPKDEKISHIFREPMGELIPRPSLLSNVSPVLALDCITEEEYTRSRTAPAMDEPRLEVDRSESLDESMHMISGLSPRRSNTSSISRSPVRCGPSKMQTNHEESTTTKYVSVVDSIGTVVGELSIKVSLLLPPRRKQRPFCESPVTTEAVERRLSQIPSFAQSDGQLRGDGIGVAEAKAMTFCHLFRTKAKKILEIRERFRRSQLPYEQRVRTDWTSRTAHS